MRRMLSLKPAALKNTGILNSSLLLSWILCTAPAGHYGRQQPLKILATALRQERPISRHVFRSSSLLLHSSAAASSRAMNNHNNNHMRVWQDGKDKCLQKTVLPLSLDSYKGSSGRIAVLGGSARYTGAPYYAAMAALKAGADLAYVFTAQEASLAIKCYSPELMVAPVYTAAAMDELVRKQQLDTPRANELVQDMVQQVVPLLERLHCLVVGPGLGRCPLVFCAVAQILQAARAQGLHVVLDADALYMLSLAEYRFLLQGYEKAILTPNVVEYKRLVDFKNNNDDDKSSSRDATSCDAADNNKAAVIDPFESVTIIQKGREDRISVGTTTTTMQRHDHVCAEEGGLKRSGGIGDILAGTVGTLTAWHAIMASTKEGSDNNGSVVASDLLPLACWTACCFVKQATKRAYQAHGRAMTAPDVLQELGPTIDAMTH